MQIDLNKIECLYKSELPFDNMPKLKSLPLFSDDVCKFLNELSKNLLADIEVKKYSDIITFAFFCRRASIEKEKRKYEASLDYRVGRGVTFHIAPSNVPINFAYSMVAGLLSGNACIIRVSSKEFPQTSIICNAIKKLYSQGSYNNLKDYIAIIKYDHDSEITEYFSLLCDVRIIFGGDNTIKEIRNSRLPSRAFDITFADRYSFCFINADIYLKEFDFNKTAKNFYNDTFLYDQNACSSPRLIIWIGNKAEIIKGKKIFWSSLYNYVKLHYEIESFLSVEKWMTICRSAIDFQNVQVETMPDNFISRIHLDALSENIPEYQCAGGSFIEFDCDNINNVNHIITRKYQTLSYIGFKPENLREWVLNNGLHGIDRIVPVGKAADFALVWDGYDLVKSLSRVCNII